MKLALAAAALALLGSTAASAGALQRSFRVGAVVVASANVSSSFVKAAGGDGISVRTGGYRSPPAALLVNGAVRVLDDAKGASLSAPANGNAVVTVLY